LTSEIESVYKWLVKTYAYKYPSEPLNQLKADITKLQQQGKSRERAVLELSLQSGLRLLELDKLKKEAGSEEEAITEYLKNETLEFDEDSSEIKDLVKKILEGQVFKSSDTLERVKDQAGSRLPLTLRYFIHGFAYSILMLILGIFWAVTFAVLLVIGSFIGFIIGLVVLLVLVGGLNSFLTDIIWSVHVKTGWMTILVHGLVLVIALVIAGIPQLIVNLYFAPNLPTQIVFFLFYAFIDGLVARKIGEQFEEQ